MKQKLTLYLYVGCGGMIGASLRYGLSLFVHYHDGFPFATLITNLIGCFLLGYLFSSTYFTKLKAPFSLALSSGVIGSFTTLSTISLETVQLWSANQVLAYIYILLSLSLGLFCCLLGYKLNWRKKVIK